jgi:DNA-binding HxlR family transcriptional regulator
MDKICDPVYAQVDKLVSLLYKSKLLHILHLLNGKNEPMRFTEIKKNIGSSSTTVARRLSELEDNGLITRQVNPTIPATVLYDLTEISRGLVPSIQAMYNWAAEYEVELK